MGLINKLKEPVLLNCDNSANDEIEYLTSIEKRLDFKGKQLLEQDLKNAKYGVIGEKAIEYELKNSHIPMYVLHNIYLESGELSAQIDYVVITRKINFIIECKNLYGNIDINNKGEFVRTIEYGNRWHKEGIYSPITQNERHLSLIKKIKNDNIKNPIMRVGFNMNFDKFNKSVVVLSNPKTVLNCRYAKKEIKDQVIRADGLIKYIKEQCSLSRELSSSDAEMLKSANWFIEHNCDNKYGYRNKYKKYIVEDDDNENLFKDSQLYNKLKAYRLQKSKDEGIKAYCIFSDAQLASIVKQKPKNKSELMSINGFAQDRVSKYGDDILNIIN